MKRALRIVLAILGIIVLLLVVGPLVVSIPPPEGTVPPEQLADADSRFITVEGIGGGLRVHYKLAGQGQPYLVLLHGFAASVYSWREVMAPLAKIGAVMAFDRPGFGLTARPLPGQWQGQSPYGPDAQPDLTVALMDKLFSAPAPAPAGAAAGPIKAVLIGNSAGGTVAVQTALRYPDRVRALILVDAAIYSGGGRPGLLDLVLNTPQADLLGPLFARGITGWGRDFGRSAWHDPSKFTDAIWAGYTVPLRAQNWDVGLWQFTKASKSLNLPEQLGRIKAPTLVITGDDDRIVPTAQSIRLAAEIPGAKLVVIPACGHVPQEERPDLFLQAVTAFLAQLP
jgi:pimeloyl-ACP methyl ester carboxylesterase